MSRRIGPGSAPYRTVNDAEILRYLEELAGRTATDPRPDPAAMSLPELTAYTERLADAGNAAGRLAAFMATGEEEYLRAR